MVEPPRQLGLLTRFLEELITTNTLESWSLSNYKIHGGGQYQWLTSAIIKFDSNGLKKTNLPTLYLILELLSYTFLLLSTQSSKMNGWAERLITSNAMKLKAVSPHTTVQASMLTLPRLLYQLMMSHFTLNLKTIYMKTLGEMGTVMLVFYLKVQVFLPRMVLF